MQLNLENQKVYLETPYTGFYVSFHDSETYPSELYSFKDAGIDQEGKFYLVCENLMGKNRGDGNSR